MKHTLNRIGSLAVLLVGNYACNNDTPDTNTLSTPSIDTSVRSGDQMSTDSNPGATLAPDSPPATTGTDPSTSFRSSGEAATPSTESNESRKRKAAGKSNPKAPASKDDRETPAEEFNKHESRQTPPNSEGGGLGTGAGPGSDGGLSR